MDIFLSLEKQSNGGRDYQAPGFSPLGDLPCRRCRDPDGEGIPIYKLPSVLKTRQLTRNNPSVPQGLVTRPDRFRGALPCLSASLRTLISRGPTWHPENRLTSTTLFTGWRCLRDLTSSPFDEGDGSDCGKIWDEQLNLSYQYRPCLHAHHSPIKVFILN